MGKWNLVSISDCLSDDRINIGKIKTKEILVEGDFPVVDQSQSFISGYSNKSEYLYIGDLPIIVYGDHTNIVKHIDFKFIQGADGIKILLPKNNIDSKYLFYAIDYFKPATQGYRRHFSLLKNISIPIPESKEIQIKIADKLDVLFEKTDKTIQFLEENLKHSKALLLSVLDEEFGNLESTYKKRPLAEIVTVINGRAYKQTEMLDSGKYPILRVGNFFSNRGWYYSDMELEDNKYCEKGDLLYAWSASFGPKIWDGEKSIYHYHIWKLVPTSNNVSKKFMYYLLERDTDKIKEEGGRGVGMIHITKGDIEKRMMVLPPLEIQEAVVSRIEKIYDLHEKLTLELKLKLENMKALKSSLLDQAFKGEL